MIRSDVPSTRSPARSRSATTGRSSSRTCAIDGSPTPSGPPRGPGPPWWWRRGSRRSARCRRSWHSTARRSSSRGWTWWSVLDLPANQAAVFLCTGRGRPPAPRLHHYGRRPARHAPGRVPAGPVRRDGERPGQPGPARADPDSLPGHHCGPPGGWAGRGPVGRLHDPGRRTAPDWRRNTRFAASGRRGTHRAGGPGATCRAGGHAAATGRPSSACSTARSFDRPPKCRRA